MKDLRRAGVHLLMLLTMLLAGCHDEPQSVPSGAVVFSFSPVNTLSGGRTQQGNPAFVSFVLQRPDGTSVSTTRPLTELNGEYVTQPEQLVPGNYAIQQFFILNSAEQSIYASPVEGSELAPFVEHPLPLSFTVAAGASTNVAPEVLEVRDHSAAEFGYATLSFRLVGVTGFRLPLIEWESITRISYEFRQGERVISGDLTTTLRTVNVNDARLREGEWDATIQVWTTSAFCYPSAYRFNSKIVFDGALVQLPFVTDGRWKKFHIVRKMAGTNPVDIMLSSDPRMNFELKVSVPNASGIRGTWDRTYWGSNDTQLCPSTVSEIFGVSSLQSAMEDSEACQSTTPAEIDSFVSFKLNGDEQHTYQYYFVWKLLQNGRIVLDCQ